MMNYEKGLSDRPPNWRDGARAGCPSQKKPENTPVVDGYNRTTIGVFTLLRPRTGALRSLGETAQGRPGKGRAGPAIAGGNHEVIELDCRRMAHE